MNNVLKNFTVGAAMLAVLSPMMGGLSKPAEPIKGTVDAGEGRKMDYSLRCDEETGCSEETVLYTETMRDKGQPQKTVAAMFTRSLQGAQFTETREFAQTPSSSGLARKGTIFYTLGDKQALVNGLTRDVDDAFTQHLQGVITRFDTAKKLINLPAATPEQRKQREALQRKLDEQYQQALTRGKKTPEAQQQKSKKDDQYKSVPTREAVNKKGAAPKAQVLARK